MVNVLCIGRFFQSWRIHRLLPNREVLLFIHDKVLFLYNDKIEPNIAFLSSPSIINEQRKLLGWNLITFGLEGIHDIFKMILIESFTSKNTKR